MVRRTLTLLTLLISAASVRAADDADFFEKKVRPLLVEKCQSCHGAEKQKGNLRVDSKASLLAGGADSPSPSPASRVGWGHPLEPFP